MWLQENRPLLDAFRRGDREAMTSVYQHYVPSVVKLAQQGFNFESAGGRFRFQGLGTSADLYDLVHDVFLRALPRLSALRDPARFGAWLAAITRNRANDYHRHTVEEVELPEDLSGDRVESNAAGGAGDAEAAFLLAVVRGLPDTYREILLLRLVEGMTGPEIAARTGLKHGSVRVNLHRGMQQLRAKLNSSVELDSPQPEMR